MSDELPEGWRMVSAADLAAAVPNALTIGPFGSNLKVADYREDGVPLVFVRDIRAESFGTDKPKFVSKAKAHELASHVVRPGDVLVTKMGEPPGDTAIYPHDKPPGIITADCIKLTPELALSTAAYLRYCIRSRPVHEQIRQQTMGVAQQKLSLARFKEILVPVPPLAEQCRIVEKVEALLAQVNAARDRLEKVSQILKRFRQSVLAAFYDGSLISQSAETWKPSVLGDVIDGFDAGRNLKAKGRPAQNGEYGVLKISAVTWGQFDPSANKALLPGDEPKEHERVRKGDLLISRANTSELVGAVVLVGEDHPNLMLPDKLLRLRFRRNQVEPEWLLYALRSQPVRMHFSDNATGTSDSMRNLSQPKMAAAPLLVPPREAQRRLATEARRLLSLADVVEGRLGAGRSMTDKLAHAILAKAFRGELVPTEAELARAEGRDYEPASVLLERIREEREANGSKKGRSTSSRSTGASRAAASTRRRKRAAGKRNGN